MVALHHIKHKPTGYTPLVIQKMGKNTNLHNWSRWCWWSSMLWHNWYAIAMASFLLQISRISRSITIWFPVILTTFYFGFEEKFFVGGTLQEYSADVFWSLNWNPVLDLLLLLLTESKPVRSQKKVVAELASESSYGDHKARLNRKNIILKTVKKREFFTPYHMMLPGSKDKKIG